MLGIRTTFQQRSSVKSWLEENSVLTSLVLSLSQIVTLILFPFSIQNLNLFTKSLFLTTQRESQRIKKIELLLCVKLITTVYRYSDDILHNRLLPSFFSWYFLLLTFLQFTNYYRPNMYQWRLYSRVYRCYSFMHLLCYLSVFICYIFFCWNFIHR